MTESRTYKKYGGKLEHDLVAVQLRAHIREFIFNLCSHKLRNLQQVKMPRTGHEMAC